MKAALILSAVGAAGAVVLGGLLWILVLRGFFLKGACPQCGSRRMRPSELPVPGDRLRALLSLTPYRCLGCGLRFYNAGWSRSPKVSP